MWRAKTAKLIKKKNDFLKRVKKNRSRNRPLTLIDVLEKVQRETMA